MSVEVVLDKAVIFVGVLLRPDTLIENGLAVSDQLARHVAVLLPAIMTAMDVGDILDLERSFRDADAAKARRAPLTASSSGATLRPDDRRLQNAASATSILCGLGVAVYTIFAFVDRGNACIAAVGPIATCATPKHYFRSGFFEPTSCSWDRVQRFDCAGMIQSKRLPENPRAVSEMRKLERIDVSGSVKLESLPRTWADIPSPRFSIDVSGSSVLARIPFAICSAENRNLTSLSMQGTEFATDIDWSGELLAEGAGQAFSDTGLNTACKEALARNRDTVKTVRLADNGLSCSTADTCGFSFIRTLDQVSFLDLSNNSVSKITLDTSVYLRLVLLSNYSATRGRGGVNLAGNRITMFRAAVLPRDEGLGLLGSFYTANHADMQEFTAEGMLLTQDDLVDLWPRFLAMRKLEKVILRENNITSVVGMFDNCLELQSVDVAGNPLLGPKGLAKAFQRQTKMTLLRLTSTGIVNVTKVLDYDLPALTLLRLNGNSLRELGDVFAHTPALQHLYLSENELTTAALAGKFTGLTELKQLTLNSNRPLSQIPDYFFQGLPSLEKLEVADNLGLVASKHAFDGLPSLQELYIQNTNIDPAGLVLAPTPLVVGFYPTLISRYAGTLTNGLGASAFAAWGGVSNLTILCDTTNCAPGKKVCFPDWIEYHTAEHVPEGCIWKGWIE